MGRAAKLKAVRRAALKASNNAPLGQLVIDRAHGPIKDVNAVTAVHAKGTYKERYKSLKKLFGASPEVHGEILAHESYQRMLAAEKKSGGPTFDHGEKKDG